MWSRLRYIPEMFYFCFKAVRMYHLLGTTLILVNFLDHVGKYVFQPQIGLRAYSWLQTPIGSLFSLLQPRLTQDFMLSSLLVVRFFSSPLFPESITLQDLGFM